jgi:hypothetical protein
MRLVPCESYKDVPKKSIFSMDEAATDMTKFKSRVVADALSMVHQFALTAKGYDEKTK